MASLGKTDDATFDLLTQQKFDTFLEHDVIR